MAWWSTRGVIINQKYLQPIWGHTCWVLRCFELQEFDAPNKEYAFQRKTGWFETLRGDFVSESDGKNWLRSMVVSHARNLPIPTSDGHSSLMDAYWGVKVSMPLVSRSRWNLISSWIDCTKVGILQVSGLLTLDAGKRHGHGSTSMTKRISDFGHWKSITLW